MRSMRRRCLSPLPEGGRASPAAGTPIEPLGVGVRLIYCCAGGPVPCALHRRPRTCLGRHHMRLLTAMMVTCMLMAVAAPAFAASHKDHDDCNADDPDRNIAGCTIVAQDLKESAKTRANAY